jgi:uncharacterized protein YbjT (DUF2867 family)
MVAPADLGRVAASLLTESAEATGLHYVEGPEWYSSGDVAAAFSKALGRAVRVVVSPRAQWKQMFRDLGFSDTAAASYAPMTAVSVDGDFDAPDTPVRGSVSLERHIEKLVKTAT